MAIIKKEKFIFEIIPVNYSEHYCSFYINVYWDNQKISFLNSNLVKENCNYCSIYDSDNVHIIDRFNDFFNKKIDTLYFGSDFEDYIPDKAYIKISKFDNENYIFEFFAAMFLFDSVNTENDFPDDYKFTKEDGIKIELKLTEHELNKFYKNLKLECEKLFIKENQKTQKILEPEKEFHNLILEKDFTIEEYLNEFYKTLKKVDNNNLDFYHQKYKNLVEYLSEKQDLKNISELFDNLKKYYVPFYENAVNCFFKLNYKKYFLDEDYEKLKFLFKHLFNIPFGTSRFISNNLFLDFLFTEKFKFMDYLFKQFFKKSKIEYYVINYISPWEIFFSSSYGYSTLLQRFVPGIHFIIKLQEWYVNKIKPDINLTKKVMKQFTDNFKIKKQNEIILF
jgi:hypothetical protein